MTSNKDMNKILKRLRKFGWVVEHSKSSHVRVVNPQGQSVIISNSCSDHRGFLNARSDLRKIGAPI